MTMPVIAFPGHADVLMVSLARDSLARLRLVAGASLVAVWTIPRWRSVARIGGRDS